jgi:hypothetical protein
VDGSDASISVKLDNALRASLSPAETALLRTFIGKVAPAFADLAAPAEPAPPSAAEVADLRARVQQLEKELAAARRQLPQ